MKRRNGALTRASNGTVVSTFYQARGVDGVGSAERRVAVSRSRRFVVRRHCKLSRCATRGLCVAPVEVGRELFIRWSAQLISARPPTFSLCLYFCAASLERQKERRRDRGEAAAKRGSEEERVSCLAPERKSIFDLVSLEIATSD